MSEGNSVRSVYSDVPWDTMTRSQRSDEGDMVLVRPGFSLVLYCSLRLADVGSAVADAIERFVAAIPNGSLRSYLASNGYHRPLSAAKFTKDMRELRALDSSYKGHRLEYSSGEEGDVGEYAIRFEGLVAEGGLENAVQFLRFEFPHDAPEKVGLESLTELVVELAQLFPYDCATAGFAFKRSGQAELKEAREINGQLRRFIGFDAGQKNVRWAMRGRTARAQWITMIGNPLLAQLGGSETIARQCADCALLPTARGIVIRAARWPVVGDVNRGAKDLGSLPNVARVLKPLRVQLPDLGPSPEQFDAAAWLSEFDERHVGDWNNR